MRYPRRTHVSALLFTAVLAQGTAHGQSSPSAADKEFAELITFFVGNWACSGHFSNGAGISSTEAFNSLMNGTWLQQVHDDRPPYGYHAYSMWGIDKESRDLVVTIHDVSGGIRLFKSSNWRESSFNIDSQPLLGHGDTNERFTYERKSSGVFTFAYSIRKGSGDWVIGDQLECRRSALPVA
jgi:hypothetical protein